MTPTGNGLIQIETAEELQALCDAARATKGGFDLLVVEMMTPERFAFVRKLRVGEHGGTWH